ncbi:hypothetical protein [Phaeacidiphilus oryzae]|uniref:hypothetical protein n=1 Tax=Phaeacidiphilus oryzae TaxID=348818 RepID=UPI00056756E8|nr:hypothetical protein [Phaeacidiphilus oryzae]
MGTVILSCIAVAVAIITAITAVWQARSARIREVESLYISRYWTLIDRMDLRTITCHALGPLEKDEEKWLRLFIRLSEDEADLRAAGWVSDDIWAIWEASIRRQFRPGAPCRRIYEMAIKDSDEERDYQYLHLRRILGGAASEQYDPAYGMSRCAFRSLRRLHPSRVKRPRHALG